MTFKARPNVHAIDLAPTGRARCRECRQLVPEGRVRVATTAFIRPGRSTRFVRCGTAACLSPAFATAVLAVYRDAGRISASPDVPLEVASAVRLAITAAARVESRVVT
jgi:hypothetical protein